MSVARSNIDPRGADEESADGSRSSSDASAAAADAVGRLAEFWGFSRHLGRAYAHLYLSPEALSTTELAERLGLSASATASVLSELTTWHAARKIWRSGERKGFWEAETSPWRVVRRVLARREGPLLVDALRQLEEARALLEAGRGRRRSGVFLAKRLDRLRRAVRAAQGVISALAEGEVAPPTDSALAGTERTER